MAFAFLASIAFACTESKTKNEKLKDLQLAALATSENYDTILVDFRLGMSETAFNQHKEDKLNSLELSNYEARTTHNLYLDDVVLHLDLEDQLFFENKLFKLELLVTTENKNYKNSTIILSTIMDPLIEAYGRPTISLTNEITGYQEVYWIDGNRQVALKESLSNSCRLTYTDLILANQVEELEAKSKNEKKKRAAKAL